MILAIRSAFRPTEETETPSNAAIPHWRSAMRRRQAAPPSASPIHTLRAGKGKHVIGDIAAWGGRAALRGWEGWGGGGGGGRGVGGGEGGGEGEGAGRGEGGRRQGGRGGGGGGGVTRCGAGARGAGGGAEGGGRPGGGAGEPPAGERVTRAHCRRGAWRRGAGPREGHSRPHPQSPSQRARPAGGPQAVATAAPPPRARWPGAGPR